MTETQRGTGRPVRVAIVGGGCAGIATAWHLSQQPGYEVTVYESSWRLGGKGASVRDDYGRILDHGLHVWLGFYENAFRMARDCYAEVRNRGWGPHEGATVALTHGCFEEAFVPEPHIGVAGKDVDGHWVVWSGHLPPAPGIPGDPIAPDANPFTLANYLLRTIDLLKTLMVSEINTPEVPDDRRTQPRASGLGWTTLHPDPPDVVVERIADRVRGATLTASAAILQILNILIPILEGFKKSTPDIEQPSQIFDRALNLLRALINQVCKELEHVVAIDPKLRWKTEIIDIVMTVAVGLVRDRVLFARNGLDAINDKDYRQWLQDHGATERTVDSRFLEGIYDFLFAYEKGERGKHSLAAGVALRGALRMFFTYRGAMFWRMRSGMGDAVFAPLYRVLLLADRKAKGDPSITLPPVKFRFRHTLKTATIETTGNARRLTKLEFQTAGDPADDGTHALDELGCWPSKPPAAKDVAGSTTLEAGRDFDAVILATSVEDLKTLGGPQGTKFLQQMPAEWNDMATAVTTAATKAAQVWLSKDLEGLGWERGSVMVSALGQGFDTWADMTSTLATERAWRARRGQTTSDHDTARSVAYFCGVMPDTVAGGADPGAKVKQDLDATLTDGMEPFWPKAFAGSSTARDLLVGDPHVQANTTGSERYVQSRPRTIAQRISPLDRTVENMTIAGDWTACGLDMGCIEAAVMSGMLAVHAITGDEPALESIVGYDHP